MSDAWQEHYNETLGNVPAPIGLLFGMDEQLGASYTSMREAAYSFNPEGLTIAMKELVFVILDIMLDNLSGAINHLNAAKNAGLRDEELRDALAIVLLMTGMSTWGKTGSAVWAHFIASAGPAQHDHPSKD